MVGMFLHVLGIGGAKRDSLFAPVIPDDSEKAAGKCYKNFSQVTFPVFVLLRVFALNSCSQMIESDVETVDTHVSAPANTADACFEYLNFEGAWAENTDTTITTEVTQSEIIPSPPAGYENFDDNGTPAFAKKYELEFFSSHCEQAGGIGMLGTMLSFPQNIEHYLTPATISEMNGALFFIGLNPDNSVYFFDHTGWPGPVRNNVDSSLYMIGHSLDFNSRNIRDAGRDIDTAYRIAVIVGRSGISVFGHPAALENIDIDFEGYDMIFATPSNAFQLRLPDEQKSDSEFWQWLTDESNAWRIAVQNPEPWHPLTDATGDLWENWGIQAFVYGGDTTLISRRGILSQIPELHDDMLYFDLVTQGDFETQYIMFHEREESKLWQLLGEYIAPLAISYSWLE